MFFSLRNRLFVVFTFLLTIPFIIFSFLIPNWFASIIEDQTQELTVEMMDQYKLYVDSIAVQAEDLGKQVLVSQAAQEWMKADGSPAELSKEKRLLLRNQLKMLLSSMMVNNSNGMSISVILNNGTGTWGNIPNLYRTAWYREYTKTDQPFIKSHSDAYQPVQGNMNSYILPLIDMNTFISYGVIKVNFPTDLLEAGLRKNTIGSNGNAYLVDREGDNVLKGKPDTPKEVLNSSLDEIVQQTSDKGLVRTDYKGENYYVFFQKLSVGDWILISEVTESELFSNVRSLQRTMLIISGIVFLMTIAASYLLSSNIVSPLGKLAKAMQLVEKGEFAGAKRLLPAIKSSNNEVGYVINVFGHTVDQLKTRIETEYEANIRRRDAEYKALLLQINPHFLNNTLEIIGGLAAQGKNHEVMDVSVHLGRMLRYSLNTHSDIVTVREEFNYIRSYAEILRIRYEESIHIRIEEDLLLKDFPVIKFFLQPLVENAVKYSFTEKTYADIFIKSEMLKGKACFIVEDKGAGMRKDTTEELMEEESMQETESVLKSKGTSIGLRNVLGRMKLYYGERFSYSIKAESGAGTQIIFYISFEEGVRNNEGAYS
ncbi:MAG: sensor histidine kinase [Bacillota bacterium]